MKEPLDILHLVRMMDRNSLLEAVDRSLGVSGSIRVEIYDGMGDVEEKDDGLPFPERLLALEGDVYDSELGESRILMLERKTEAMCSNRDANYSIVQKETAQLGATINAHAVKIDELCKKADTNEQIRDSLEKTAKECDLKIADTIVSMLGQIEALQSSGMGTCKRLSELESARKIVDNLVGSVFSINERVDKLEKGSPTPPHGAYQGLVEASKAAHRALGTLCTHEEEYLSLDTALEELGVG